jgi:hypothetical protein
MAAMRARSMLTNSPTASTVTTPFWMRCPRLWVRRWSCSVTQASNNAGCAIRVGFRYLIERVTVGPAPAAMTLAAVNIMSNAPANTAPCTQPGAPS